MKRKNILKGLLISIASLIGGFIAISLPFHFFNNLTSSQMTIMFATEILVYTGVGLIFLTARQAELDREERAKQRKQERKAEIKRLETDWFDLVA